MSNLVPPHGGQLKPLLLDGEERSNELEKAKSLHQVRMNSRETSDLIMLGMGAFSPLDGFMRYDDYVKVVETMHTADGTLWPIPITLSVEKKLADSMKINDEVALIDDDSDELMGTMKVEDKFNYDKNHEAKNVFRTDDQAHPGVAKIFGQNDTYLAGTVKVISEGEYPDRFRAYYARPAEPRAIFAQMGWNKVAGFQTRNPIHRPQFEMTIRAMRQAKANILIHPVVGMTRPGDFDHFTRVRCYKSVTGHYPPNTWVLNLLPFAMRMAGPREALLDTIIAKNYGCTHFIVGRGHASPGKDGNGELFYEKN